MTPALDRVDTLPTTHSPGAPAALPPLTSIRGIAALAVVLFHIRETFDSDTLVFIESFRNGWLGVDLFFVLSGFIMAHVYTTASVRGRAWAFSASFLTARLARIYPLHLATLLATLALALLLPDFRERFPRYFGADTFALNLLLLQGWGLSSASWNMVSWSISAEWFMYLLFPLLLISRQAVLPTAGRWTMPRTFALIASVLAAHLAIILGRGWSDYGGMAAGGMVRVFFEFALGFLVYHVRDELHPAASKPLFEVYSLLVCAMVALAFFNDRNWLLFVPAVALMIATLGANQGLMANLLSRRPMVYLGEISFSLYMWHWLVIQIHSVLRDRGLMGTPSRTSLYLQSLSMVVVSLLVAALSFWLIEKPARSWINRGKARLVRRRNIIDQGA